MCQVRRHFIAKYQHKRIANRPVPRCSQYQEFTAITRNYEDEYIGHNMLTAYLLVRLRVRPHRKRAAAAGSDLCPRREGVRILLCKIASSPSNRRRADAADLSRSQRVADICVLETDLPEGQYRMAEKFTEKLIEKLRRSTCSCTTRVTRNTRTL